MDGRTDGDAVGVGAETAAAGKAGHRPQVLTAREFLSITDQEVRRATRYTRPLSVGIVLLDNLPQTIDAEGADAARAIVQSALIRVDEVLRSPDQIARLGPGEFGMLLPETRLEQAYIAAQRLRSSLADQALETPVGPRQVSLCIGLAALSPRIRNPKTFLMKACVELRRARAQGPGTVCAAAPDTNRMIRPATRAVH